MRPLVTFRRAAQIGAASLLSALALGCTPELPQGDLLSRLDLDGGSGGSSGGLALSIEPSAPIDSAPRVLRVHVAFPSFTFDPTRMALVHGAIVPRELHEIAEQKVSATLHKRVVPALTWSEGAGEVLAPTTPLEPGAVYTVAMGDLPAALEITIASEDAVPLLSRLWPPSGASATAGLAIWCGLARAPTVDAHVATMPARVAGTILDGVVSTGSGRDCVRFEADPPVPAGRMVAPSVPPPVVASEVEPPLVARLDPEPLRADVDPTPIVPAVCVPDEVPFGPGCVQVLDDRLLGRSAAAPLLWAVAGAAVDTVIAAGAGDPFVITGLLPSKNITLDVAAIDTAGRTHRSTFEATTPPPAPHVVVNEVLAWPLGASPDEEWVEITNDGQASAALDGYVLFVGNTATPLPAATLGPGKFALLVSDAYMAAGGPDVPPAPGTLLLRVPHLGKEGLTKKGEAFTLLDADANAVSAFPATPKPKLGSSVARVAPSAPDTLASSFALATPSPGRTNTW